MSFLSPISKWAAAKVDGFLHRAKPWQRVVITLAMLWVLASILVIAASLSLLYSYGFIPGEYQFFLIFGVCIPPLVCLGIVSFVVLVCIPLAGIFLAAFHLISLPMQRQERTRLFLDLLDDVLKNGRNVEQTLVSIAESRDNSMGPYFHLLAAHLESGLRLSEALDKTPHFLPSSIRTMLQAGFKIGDVRAVLPACRRMLKDGRSQTQGAANYALLTPILLAPVGPLVLWMPTLFVFPKFREIIAGMGFDSSPLTAWVLNSGPVLTAGFTLVFMAFVLAALLFVAGPYLRHVPSWDGLSLQDRLHWLLPWRRKRMQRNFAAMLAVLLDAGMPEEQALLLAAECADNGIFLRRAQRAAAELKQGVTLLQAIRRLDDAGEFQWRLANGAGGKRSFFPALQGWLEHLDAKAFQQEQAAAHVVSTLLVLLNGGVTGLVCAGVFQYLITIIETAASW